MDTHSVSFFLKIKNIELTYANTSSPDNKNTDPLVKCVREVGSQRGKGAGYRSPHRLLEGLGLGS